LNFELVDESALSAIAGIGSSFQGGFESGVDIDGPEIVSFF
jgi:hypothetical protein